MKTIALILFLVTYALLLVCDKWRAYVAAGAAVLFILLGILPLGSVMGAVDWNVLLMICGTMGTVSLFIDSRMPARLADIIIRTVPNVKWAIVSLALFAGIISAFVDNVATVLMVAPVALAVSKKIGISPVPVVIAIAVSSNLQGAATLVGDTTSILLGGYAGMNFMDFFWFMGRPGMFWVVELGAFLSMFVLLFYFRKEKAKVTDAALTPVEDYFPTALMVGTVLLLIVASFLPHPPLTNGIICNALFLLGLVREMLKTKKLDTVRHHIGQLDWRTLLLLGGLFVVIGGIQNVGLIQDISQIFVTLAGDNLFVIFTLIVWVSVLLSAVIDNIPYVATMLPVVAGIAQLMGVEPYLLYFGLLVGATLGGNLTPIGASANITGIGILRRAGYSVSFKDFARIGVPFTLVAVLSGYLAIWLLWS